MGAALVILLLLRLLRLDIPRWVDLGTIWNMPGRAGLSGQPGHMAYTWEPSGTCQDEQDWQDCRDSHDMWRTPGNHLEHARTGRTVGTSRTIGAPKHLEHLGHLGLTGSRWAAISPPKKGAHLISGHAWWGSLAFCASERLVRAKLFVTLGRYCSLLLGSLIPLVLQCLC